MAQQDYYTILTSAGLAYEANRKALGLPIKLTEMSVGDGNGAVYNPSAAQTALAREVWRGPINALLQDTTNPTYLVGELTLPDDVGGWYVREVGFWTDSGILYAIGKYPESFKPELSAGAGKEFYIRAIFETSNADSVTLVVDDTVVKATRAYVIDYVAAELAKLDHKNSVRVATTGEIVLSGAQSIDGVAVVAGDRVLVKNQGNAAQNGIYVAAVGAWARSADADISAEVTSGLVVTVEQGTTLAETRWQLVTDGVIVLGTAALTFQNVTQGFAPLASPTFSGNPAAPTPAQFDNDTSVATTAFVQRALGNLKGISVCGSSQVLPVSIVGSWIAVSAAGLTLTLPLAGSVPNGSVLHFFGNSLGLTVAKQGSDSIFLGASRIVANVALGVSDRLTLVSVDSGWYAICGDATLQQSSFFGSSLVSNGWQLLPSGLIVQWGTVTVPPNASQAFLLPIAYKSAHLIAVGSRQADGSNAVCNVGTNGGSFTQIRVQNFAATAEICCYLSLGR